jgi:predicted RNase H-like HicB family nuclease
MKSSEEYLQLPYARIVIPDGPNGFHGEVLEFPGCFAQGDTVDEAYANLENAAESWIGASLAQGHEIPLPSSSLTYSGKIVLRLPKSIHRQAARLAERDAVSLNTYLVSAVAAKVGAEDFYATLTDRFENRIMETAYSFLGYIQVAQTAGNSIRPLPNASIQTGHTASTNLVRLTKGR